MKKLNRPTVYTLDNVAGFNDLMPEFTGSRLYLGGDVGANTTRILHSYGELEGSDEVVKGVYVGGYKAVKEHVSSGKSKSSDFKWFARYSGAFPQKTSLLWFSPFFFHFFFFNINLGFFGAFRLGSRAIGT